MYKKSDKKCCVIGGSGFIGKHVLGELIKNGRKVVVVGRKSPESVTFPTGVEYCAHDYGDDFFFVVVETCGMRRTCRHKKCLNVLDTPFNRNGRSIILQFHKNATCVS